MMQFIASLKGTRNSVCLLRRATASISVVPTQPYFRELTARSPLIRPVYNNSFRVVVSVLLISIRQLEISGLAHIL